MSASILRLSVTSPTVELSFSSVVSYFNPSAAEISLAVHSSERCAYEIVGYRYAKEDARCAYRAYSRHRVFSGLVARTLHKELTESVAKLVEAVGKRRESRR